MSYCGRCRDCKHWYRCSANLGSCERSTLAELGIRGEDGETLYCSPDFGCVQFEAKRASNER